MVTTNLKKEPRSDIIAKMFSPRFGLLLVVLFGLFVPGRSSQDMLRYKVCTAEELRRSVDQFCIRIAERQTGVGDSMPYGAPASLDISSELESHTELVEVIKASRSYARFRARQQDIHHKRDFEVQGSRLCDYLNYCCNESCVISTKELAPYCRG